MPFIDTTNSTSIYFNRSNRFCSDSNILIILIIVKEKNQNWIVK